MLGMTRKKVEELDPSEVTADAVNEVIEKDRENGEEAIEAIPLGWREKKALKRSKYSTKQPSYKKEFVLFNKRTGQIAEVKGVTELHACKSIGWRARQVKVLEIKKVTTEEEKNHTAGSSEVNI